MSQGCFLDEANARLEQTCCRGRSRAGVDHRRRGALRPTGGEWREGRGIIVRPDIEHSFNARGATGGLLFVDPESTEGVWLQSVLTDDITFAPEARLKSCLTELQAFMQRPLESMDVSALVRHCVL